MKLKRYLLESSGRKIKFESSKELRDTIINDCKKYLDLLKGKNPLYRAVQENVNNKSLLKKDVRKMRMPSGTPLDEFIGINKWLTQQGHTRRDESVIASVTRRFMFGNPYYFFPIGDFDFTFVKSKDFNFSNDKSGWYPRDFASEILYYGEKSELSKATTKWNDYFFTNKNFEFAYRMDYEIWFNCKNYYLCNELDWEQK